MNGLGTFANCPSYRILGLELGVFIFVNNGLSKRGPTELPAPVQRDLYV